MSYYRRVVKKRPACMTDEEMVTLRQKAREHALAMQGEHGPPMPPVVVKVLLCMWCRRLHSPAEVEACMAMKRPETVNPANGALSSCAKIGKLLADYSECWEFLTRCTYSDGKTRQPGSLSLRLASGGLQGTLTDPSSGSFCTLLAESLDDLLLTWELGLKDGTLPWRQSSYSKPRKG